MYIFSHNRVIYKHASYLIRKINRSKKKTLYSKVENCRNYGYTISSY